MRIVQFLWNMSLSDGGVVRAVLDLCPLLSRGVRDAASPDAMPAHDVTLMCCLDTDVPTIWARSREAGLPAGWWR